MILTKIVNDCYINHKLVNYKEFNRIFYDLQYKQIYFANYIKNGQLVNEWVLANNRG